MGKTTFYSKDAEQRFYGTEVGKLPSVTTVLRVIAKPALIQWSANASAEYFRPVLEGLKSGGIDPSSIDIEELIKGAKSENKNILSRAADVGSALHGYISDSFNFQGWESWEGDGLIPQELQAGWKAFVDWRISNTVVPRYSEFVVWSRKGFAGTLDFFGLCNAKQSLIDFKSGSALYEEHLYQVAAYSYAFEEMTGEKIERYGILRLDRNTGLPEWKEFTKKEITEAYVIFLLCLKLWQLKFKK